MSHQPADKFDNLRKRAEQILTEQAESLNRTPAEEFVVRSNFWTQPEGSKVEVVKGKHDEQKTPRVQRGVQIGNSDGGPSG